MAETGLGSDAGNDGHTGDSGADAAVHDSGIDAAAHDSGVDGAAHDSGVDGAAHDSGVDGAAHDSGVDGAARDSGIDGERSDSAADAMAGAFDAGSSVTCTLTSQFGCTPSTGCVAPAPVNITVSNIPLYVISPCEGFYATSPPFTPSNYSIVFDAPQIFANWNYGDTYCLGTDTFYPGELVTDPIDPTPRGQFSGVVALAGTAATIVAWSGSYASFVPGCTELEGNCEYTTISCTGSATALLSTCTTNKGGCDPNATCAWATPTTNTCACNTGYMGNGYTCTPVANPCLTANGGCSANATCTDNLGVAECQCNVGFTGTGINCVANP